MEPPPDDDDSAPEEESDVEESNDDVVNDGHAEDDEQVQDEGPPASSGSEDGGEDAGGDSKHGGSGDLAALKKEMEDLRRKLDLEKIRHERSLLKAEQRLAREREAGYRRLLRHHKDSQEARVRELSAQASRSHHAMLTNMVLANNNSNLQPSTLSSMLLQLLGGQEGGQEDSISARALLQDNNSIG